MAEWWVLWGGVIMKERPILFKEEMVRAILDGTKTQTRRIMKYQPDSRQIEYLNDHRVCLSEESLKQMKSPKGQPGDRLYVRETFWQLGHWKKNGWTKTGKQAWTFEPHGKDIIFTPQEKPDYRIQLGYHKRPSIFLPKWASRINLEITDVRVDRVQSIQGKDIIAEGVVAKNANPAMGIRWWNMLRIEWEHLWDSINGNTEYNWAANPWVWVYTFKVVS